VKESVRDANKIGIVNENDPDLRKTISKVMERLVPLTQAVFQRF
jgi:thiamine phosphate synthase YjbQ (UPF0047 family)